MCRHSLLVCLVAGVLTTAGCTEASKSRNPLSPDVAGPIAGVSITAPAPLEPGDGESVEAGAPVTLTFKNATTNGERPLQQHLQLASDAQFSKLIVNFGELPVAEDGQTEYRVPQPLPANQTYYWRVRGFDGANTGSFSATASFEVVAPVALEPPVPVLPIGGQVTETTAPGLVATNGAVSGPAGQVAYRFEVAADPQFASMEAVLTVPRAKGGQTTAPLGNVGPDRLLYWRVQALSAKAKSGYSPVESFRTPAAPAPKPPPAPAPEPPPSDPEPPPSGPAPPPPGPEPPPSGGGARPPDPPAGQRLPFPGWGAGVVQQVAAAYPDALRHSCQEHDGPRGWEFLDRVVDALRAQDTRFAYNGKRGNPNDPSKDVVSYHFGPGPDNLSMDVYVIDVIVGHCGSSPGPTFNDVSERTWRAGTTGIWISRGRF